MRRSNFALRVPPTVLAEARKTAESEGVANAAATAHGGGQRWPKGSPEYETILKWIAGKQ